LDDPLQGLDSRVAGGTHGLQRQMEGVTCGIGGNGLQEVDKLLAVDEAERPQEHVDPAAAGVNAGRHEVDEVGPHPAVADDHRRPGHHAPAQGLVVAAAGDVDHGKEIFGKSIDRLLTGVEPSALQPVEPVIALAGRKPEFPEGLRPEYNLAVPLVADRLAAARAGAIPGDIMWEIWFGSINKR